MEILLSLSLMYVSIANAEEPYSKFSIDLRGWSGNRTLVDKWALNSLLNSSPGEFSHLRGGEINEEKAGPEIFVSANYFLHPDLALRLCTGDLANKTCGTILIKCTCQKPLHSTIG